MKTSLEIPMLEEAISDLVRRAEAKSAAHPSPAELFAFANDELPELAAEEIREHLATCAPCGDLILAFGDFDEGVSLEEAHIRHRPSPVPGLAAHYFRMSTGIAAVALFAAAFGLVVGYLGRPAAVFSPILIELAPESTTRAVGPDSRNLPLAKVPSANIDAPLVLVLSLASTPPEELEAQIRDEGTGKIAWRSTLRSSQDGIVTLAFPPRTFDPAIYLVELRSRAGGWPPLVYKFEAYSAPAR